MVDEFTKRGGQHRWQRRKADGNLLSFADPPHLQLTLAPPDVELVDAVGWISSRDGDLDVLQGLPVLLLLVEGSRPIGSRPGKSFPLQQDRVAGGKAHRLCIQSYGKLKPGGKTVRNKEFNSLVLLTVLLDTLDFHLRGSFGSAPRSS